MSGPTTDYSVPPQIRERADGATASGAELQLHVHARDPRGRDGHLGLLDRSAAHGDVEPGAPPGPTTVRDAAFNPVFYAAVTDSEAVPRRVVVDIAKCNVCHDRLALHGSNRLNPQECVFCHNPNGNDGREPPESIDFKRMIHQIHTGVDLTHDYSIGDDGSFNGVRFPGDRRDCQKCHTTARRRRHRADQREPAAGSPARRQTPRDWYSPMQHNAAACLAATTRRRPRRTRSR